MRKTKLIKLIGSFVLVILTSMTLLLSAQATPIWWNPPKPDEGDFYFEGHIVTNAPSDSWTVSDFEKTYPSSPALLPTSISGNEILFPNLALPDLTKQVWGWFETTGSGPGPKVPKLEANAKQIAPTHSQVDNSLYTWVMWEIIPQPNSEKLIFDNLNSVSEMIVVTKCVPEPATILLFSSGLLGFAAFRKKSRK